MVTVFLLVTSARRCSNQQALTYYVPTMCLVLAGSSFQLKILARPKSDILGFHSPSRRMLLALRSLWMTLTLEYRCK